VSGCRFFLRKVPIAAQAASRPKARKSSRRGQNHLRYTEKAQHRIESIRGNLFLTTKSMNSPAQAGHICK
jgi:hypothetical protein